MAPWWHPQKVENFEILMDFDACWTPQDPPPRATAGPRIAKSAPARVSGAEWRERISVHKAAIRQMHCAPGPAGAVRTQKVVIWPPKNRIAKSAPARVSGAEWRKRISAHKAAVRQMHCAPGPAGAFMGVGLCFIPERIIPGAAGAAGPPKLGFPA
eukprot:gene16983-biopygen17301